MENIFHSSSVSFPSLHQEKPKLCPNAFETGGKCVSRLARQLHECVSTLWGMGIYVKLCHALALSVALAFIVASAPSQATLLTVTFPNGFDGMGNTNDCSGVFGNFDDPCDVGLALDPATMISPIIAKYDVDESLWEINPGFPSIDASEWTLGDTSAGSGTWSYSPTGDDPAIRYWVGKGGNNGFNLFWVVPDGTASCAGDTLASYNLDCLNAAVAQTSGDWSTPTGQGLSHITFYDSDEFPPIPEPGTAALLIVGLGGLFAAGRRS